MAEFEFEATASDVPPPPPTTIYTLGFDEETVQQALAKTDGNEELAIDLILSGEARGAVAASTFQAAAADDFGHTAHAANSSAPEVGLGSAATASNLARSKSSVYLHFTMGLKENIVQQALTIADGNEDLALDFILDGDIRSPEFNPAPVAVHSLSSASLHSSSGTAAPPLSTSSPLTPSVITHQLLSRCLCLYSRLNILQIY